MIQKNPEKAHKHHGTQKYCMLCKKAEISEQKYMSHSAEYCTGMRTNWTIKDRMGEYTGSRNDTTKKYKNS